jgi:hypothetical protein
MGRNPFAFADGDIARVMITLFLMTIYGVMVGGISQMREIVKEADIYKRERLVNLKILPYVMSKVWVAALLAFYQAAAYTIVHYLAFSMPGGALEFAQIYITMTLATLAGMMLGLFASALAPNASSAPLMVIILMLPQIVLGGALIPVPEFISAPTSTRWAFEALMSITGSGSDVAADLCWKLDPAAQNALTLEDKLKPIGDQPQGCRCMGVNMLHESSCNHPGLGRFPPSMSRCRSNRRRSRRNPSNRSSRRINPTTSPWQSSSPSYKTMRSKWRRINSRWNNTSATASPTKPGAPNYKWLSRQPKAWCEISTPTSRSCT